MSRSTHLLAGIAGGIAGSTAMLVFNHLLAASDFAPGDLGHHDQHRRTDAKPNDTDGTISDEPASITGTAGPIERMTGRRLPEPARRSLGLAGHYLFGAAIAAPYALLAARTAAVIAGAGLPYGALVWLGAVEIGLPAIGLARHPRSYPLSRHLASLGSHLVFGATVEAVRRTIMSGCCRSGGTTTVHVE
jgi:hypothetical protein